MPYYRWRVPEGSVEFDTRRQVAKAFTDIHCGSTGAPRSFVHVEFAEGSRGADAPAGERYFLDGFNRAGRPEEVKQALLSDLLDSFVSITGVDKSEVGGRINEGPASWSMEGGMVLPEPGEETEEWYAHDGVAAGG